MMQYFRKIRGLPFLCAAALFGLLLLFPRDTAEGVSMSDTAMPQEISMLCAYEEHLAHKIAQMTNALLGCENTTVIVTLASVPSGDTDAYFGSKAAAEISVPKPTGIAVACRGGDDAVVQLRVSNMLTAVFDLPVGCVFVGENRSSAVPNER